MCNIISIITHIRAKKTGMHGTPKARYHTYVFRAQHGKYFVSKQNKQKAYEAPVPGIIGVLSTSLEVCLALYILLPFCYFGEPIRYHSRWCLL